MRFGPRTLYDENNKFVPNRTHSLDRRGHCRAGKVCSALQAWKGVARPCKRSDGWGITWLMRTKRRWPKRRRTTRYAPWFGRGYVQLTWEENYQKQQDKLHAIEQVHIYKIPYKVHDDWNLALVPSTSAIITVGGMKDGDFTGKKLNDYIKPGSVDYVNARRIVNGTDRAEQIAGYAREYESALRAGMDG